MIVARHKKNLQALDEAAKKAAHGATSIIHCASREMVQGKRSMKFPPWPTP